MPKLYSRSKIYFFLSCTDYAALRKDLLGQLGHRLPQHNNLTNQLETRKILIMIVLLGTRNDKDTDFEIFDIIATFIMNTKRFELYLYLYSLYYYHIVHVTIILLFRFIVETRTMYLANVSLNK